MKKLAFLILMTSSLSACASTNAATANQQNSVDSTNVAIAQAANSISKQLVNLARVEQAAHPTQKPLPPANPETYGMGALSSVNWSGPIEPLLKKIAEATGYKLKVIGGPPAMPVMVTVAEKNVPIGDIVRNIGLQARSQEHLLIFPTIKTIQLTYLQQ